MGSIVTKCVEMTREIFLWKGIDLLEEDGEDSSEVEETSTDDTDKQTDNKFKCSLKITRLITIFIKGCSLAGS